MTRPAKAFAAIVLCGTWTVFATVYHTKDYGSAQEVISLVQPGDAVVFDGDADGDVAVSAPLHDVQFFGGGAHWSVSADMVDCAFFWHSMRLTQTAGRIRRCVFYKSMSSGGMVFTHADSVSLYYDNNYLWPKWNPDDGRTPQLQFDGFVRGVLVHRPIVGLLGYSRVDGSHVFDLDHAPALFINATHHEGNGWGTYISGPIVWEQTNWMPFHIARGVGVTFAHANAEYNVWADPIAEFDYGIDCMLLCNGPGGRGDASNDAYKQIRLLQYPDHIEYGNSTNSTPYRGSVFRLGGQRNRVVGMGSYKNWTIGPKDWLPCVHWEDGITVRDPFYTEWPGDKGTVRLNFAAYKNTFKLNRKGEITTYGQGTYPADGADVIRPVIMPIPDLRACPARLNKNDVQDLTGSSTADIAAALDGGASVYLGPGEYTFNAPLTDGLVIGAGIDSTTLVFTHNDANTNKGFVNCTVRGGKYGLKSTGGILGKALLRTRFENMDAGLYNDGCWQNDVINSVEFVNCGQGMLEGPNGCSEPFKTDKIHIINCAFKDITSHGIAMSTGTPRNGHNAVLNCTFENVGGNAILIEGGGTHLVQNVTVKNCGMADGRNTAVAVISRSWGKAVCMSHIDVDNTGSSAAGTAIMLGGYGVLSHATVEGFGGETAVHVKAESAVDHVTADGNLEGGAFVARSSFAGFSVGTSDDMVATRSSNVNTLVQGHVQPLDNTPPPAVADVTVEHTSNDPAFPYYTEYNLISWSPVEDDESGIIAYIIYAGGREVGRTPGVRCDIRNIDYSNDHATDTLFRDPEVSHSSYTVKPVNGANMLPDGSQAPLRRWTAIRARWRTDNGEVFKAHRIDGNAKTLRDTIRDLQVNWEDTSGSPRLVNGCGMPQNFNERAVAHWGALSAGASAAPVARHAAGRLVRRAMPRLTATGFWIPDRCHVRVSVFDMLGRRVAVPVNRVVDKGSHTLRLGAMRLPSRLYVLCLETPDRRVVTGSLLLR